MNPVEELREIFGPRLAIGPECWPVSGRSTGNGYSKISYQGKDWIGHRLSWAVVVGEIPTDMMVLHTCRNRSCANPAHLYLGTAKDNAQDSIRDGTKWSANRGKTHCIRGHALSGRNLIRYRRKDGAIMRQCRKCQNMTRNLRRYYLGRGGW